MKYTLLLSLANIVVSSLAAFQFDKSNIIDFNVTRSSYHIGVTNKTEVEQWSLSNIIVPDTNVNGTALNVAIIGDGINDKYLETKVTVHDTISNSTFLFTNNEITQDTLSAIILLNNSPSTILKSFKIFKELNSTTSLTQHLVDAVELALNDYSIDLIYINTWQSYGGWSDSELSKFLNKVAQVKPIVMPMGQSFGMFQMSDGASAPGVISVGSSGFDGIMGYPILIDEEYYGYYSNEQLDLYPNNTLVLGELDDQCMLVNNVSAEKSELLFIDVGNCTSLEVVKAVSMSNFTQLLTIGNEYQIYNFPEQLGITSAMLSKSSGKEILSKLQDDEELVAQPISNIETQILMDYNFDAFSINFNSSMGPTLDLQLKPNVLAQGSYYFPDLNIFASGTAFSTAYVVGMISLFSLIDENWNIGLVDRVTSSGILTSYRNMTDVFDGIVQNPVVQGGGILNDFDFLYKEYSANPSFFNLGENQTNDTEIVFTLTNDNKETTKKFYINGVESITLYSQNSIPDSNGDSIYPHPVYGNETSSDIFIDENVVILKPGKSVNITAQIIIPDYNSELNRIPIFGGYIEILDVVTGIISNLPYFGTPTRMNEIETQTDADFYWKEYHYGKQRACELWKDGSVVNDTNHYLQIYWNNRIGSPMVDILVVDKDWTDDDFTYPPVKGENKFIDRIKGTRIPGGFPWLNVPRTNVTAANQWEDWHYGLLDDDSILKDGEYRILLLILNHNYQNTSDINDWYTHLSPYFVQNYINISEVVEPKTTVSITHFTTLQTSSLKEITTATASSMDMDMNMDDMKM